MDEQVVFGGVLAITLLIGVPLYVVLNRLARDASQLRTEKSV